MSTEIKVILAIIAFLLFIGGPLSLYLNYRYTKEIQDKTYSLGEMWVEEDGKKIYLDPNTGKPLTYEQLRERQEYVEQLTAQLQEECNRQTVEYNRMFDACKIQIQRKDELIQSMRAAGYKEGL